MEGARRAEFWDLESVPLKFNVASPRYIFAWMTEDEDYAIKPKVRLVARGVHQKYMLDFLEKHAATPALPAWIWWLLSVSETIGRCDNLM